MKSGIFKKLIIVAIAIIAVAFFITALFSEPKLVVSNSYKHRGDYNGDYSVNAYTFEIKNNSFFKDIDSVDYFRIYFYDKAGDYVDVWNAGTSELLALALDARDDYVVQIGVAEDFLPYDEGWSFDTEYYLYYYD